MSRADLDKDPHDVAAMFDGVARRYDLTNTVLTAGQDRRWRALTRDALDAAPRRAGAGPRGRDGGLDGGARPLRRLVRGRGLLPRHAARRAGPRRPDGRRGRPRPALRRRRVRRGDDLVRPAQRRRPRRRAGRAGPGDPARGPAGGLRVRHADLGALPRRLPRRRAAARAAGGRPGGVEQPRGLPLPRRVDPRLARAAPRWRAGSGGGLDRRRLARPRGRRRRPAPGAPAGGRAPGRAGTSCAVHPPTSRDGALRHRRQPAPEWRTRNCRGCRLHSAPLRESVHKEPTVVAGVPKESTWSPTSRRGRRRRDRGRCRARRFDRRHLPRPRGAGRAAAGEVHLPAPEGLRRRVHPPRRQAAHRPGHRLQRGDRLAAQPRPARARRRASAWSWSGRRSPRSRTTAPSARGRTSTSCWSATPRSPARGCTRTPRSPRP